MQVDILTITERTHIKALIPRGIIQYYKDILQDARLARLRKLDMYAEVQRVCKELVEQERIKDEMYRQSRHVQQGDHESITTTGGHVSPSVSDYRKKHTVPMYRQHLAIRGKSRLTSTREFYSELLMMDAGTTCLDGAKACWTLAIANNNLPAYITKKSTLVLKQY